MNSDCCSGNTGCEVNPYLLALVIALVIPVLAHDVSAQGLTTRDQAPVSPLVIQAKAPPVQPKPLPFPAGGRSPDGHTLSVNDRYLMRDGEPWFPVMGEFDELLMVVREAIYNAVRHGRSSKVQVVVQFDTDRCDVKIRDDVAGFDPQSVSSLPAGHYGLVGMKERITRVGGELTLNSRPGGGAEVTFHIPRGPFVPSDDIEVMR